MSYVIEGLIPFSDANLKLVFRPNDFFRDMAQHSSHNQRALANAYYRAQSKGIVRKVDGGFVIDDTYLQSLRYMAAEQLPKNQVMLVTYDIPESQRAKRRELRSLLRQLGFLQEQKSVWVSSYNHFEPVLALIGTLKIKPHVQVYIGSTAYDQYMLG